MKQSKKLTVSRSTDIRAKSNISKPALRISGKWLKQYCNIGDKYRIIPTDNPNELLIQFIGD